MSRLPLTYYGNPVLRIRCQPIDSITPEIAQLAQEMMETVVAVSGVGLAAPQVGRLVRMFIVREEKEIENGEGEFEFLPPEVIINPVLFNPSAETQTDPEGCLSIPGIEVAVRRPLEISVRYQTLTGEIKEERPQGFRARIFMHENDHINGVLMIDRIPASERKKCEPFLRKMKGYTGSSPKAP